jgi:hypothetical protein
MLPGVAPGARHHDSTRRGKARATRATAAIPAPDAAMIKELEDIRNSIVDLHEKRSAIETAPPPSKLLIAQKTAEIDAILDALCDPKKRLGFVETNLILIAANSEQLKKAIGGHIEHSIGKAGLSAEQKATQLAALDHKIVQLEQKEERICMAIEAAGAFVTRRADFPPAIFFAVSAEDDMAQTGAAHSLVSSAPQPSAM